MAKELFTAESADSKCSLLKTLCSILRSQPKSSLGKDTVNPAKPAVLFLWKNLTGSLEAQSVEPLSVLTAVLSWANTTGLEGSVRVASS